MGKPEEARLAEDLSSEKTPDQSDQWIGRNEIEEIRRNEIKMRDLGRVIQKGVNFLKATMGFDSLRTFRIGSH